MRRATRVFAPVPVALLAALSFGACSSDDGDSASPDTTEAAETTSTTVAADTGCVTAETGPLQILLVNDDGMVNPAIDVMIDRLSQNEDFELTVVAPADEKSGSSDRTTEGGATYEEATTPGGNEGYAVDGFPADAVLVALDDLGLEPDLVVSGINPGHNFGPLASLSGTVGVGRTAIRRDVPALAMSAGLELDDAQFGWGADFAADWIEENCEALIGGEFQTDTVTSVNIPTCPPEEMGPLQEVPRAEVVPELPEGESVFVSLCDLTPDPADDIAAVRAGYPSLTQVPADI
ncbi:5'/3'-nucleotidase SurE [Rhabdothermincola salaria]|uniref:5'/3'-nucleotidase SurE n=1 Tax=Rhabdothermincola salaria TaxID=2903142 RepID=UPI001E4C06B3|nr:5'/3'-nucleotidase SurE [Rhabdothermincola salaria]